MDSIVHFEIPADDISRAETFYKTAFGWNMNSMPGFGYTMIQTAESDDNGPKERARINGGMLKRQNPIQSPILTISVDSMDAAIETVKSNGGTIVRESKPVGDMGLAAYFKDTEGNVLGLWQVVKK